MLEDKLITILIQGGLTSVSLMSLYVNYKLVIALKEIVANHLVHSNDALKELSTVLSELKVLIQTHIKKPD